MARLTIVQHKRLRGLVLELLDQNHKDQGSRYDDVGLWSLVQDMGQRDVSLNDLVTALQDLKMRGYLKYSESIPNKRTLDRVITEIEIMPAGRGQVEKTAPADPAVTIL
jgi:hypothetical protein